jgi:nucleoside-diphosphate-sugar epimerase
MSIMDIARTVREVVKQEFPDRGDIDIVTTPTDDIRSYHINSDKIRRKLGFVPRHSVADAVRDLCKAFKAGKLPNSMTDDQYFNVRRLKALRAA